MKIIFGLGNYGQKYKNNRHNIGWMVVDSLVNAQGLNFKRSFRFTAFVTKAKIDNQDVLLVKPRTFMNNSGLCVKKLFKCYKIPAGDVLVVYDDVDLKPGQIRFKKEGSSGGHRGMASVIEALGTENINRLRVGIGRDSGLDTSIYVLADFSRQEKEMLPEVITEAVSICRDWVKQGG
jgi:PTH1 family peptidyl-tRNA hydrolase